MLRAKRQIGYNQSDREGVLPIVYLELHENQRYGIRHRKDYNL